MDITNLPYPRKKGIKNKKTFVPTFDLHISQWIIPAGTELFLITGDDHGFVILSSGCKDKRGIVNPRRIFWW